MDAFIEKLNDMIKERRKMTSRLYQLIMEGGATKRLLQNFVIHRYPIKKVYVRNVMGVAARIEEHDLRRKFVENIYEEETGGITDSDYHLNVFLNFGRAVGVSPETVLSTPLMPETKELLEHNMRACNDTSVPMTEGAASVLLLMEGQPPIVAGGGRSMEAVMRDVYQLPPEGYEFFTHHASNTDEDDYVSALESTHTSAIVELLKTYCTTPELQEGAVRSLRRAIDLRHKHFDAIYERFYDPSEPAFRYGEVGSAAAPAAAV
jgi:pyrroloquinoline-quinone synthase